MLDDVASWRSCFLGEDSAGGGVWDEEHGALNGRLARKTAAASRAARN